MTAWRDDHLASRLTDDPRVSPWVMHGQKFKALADVKKVTAARLARAWGIPRPWSTNPHGKIARGWIEV